MIPTALCFLLLIRFSFAATCTLTEAPSYASQRPCAQECFYIGAYSGPDELASNVGCDMKDIENECICRPDLQAGADAYLKQCVSSRCDKNTLDINSAVSIYDDYCASAGFHRAADAPTTTTTSGSSIATSNPSSQSRPTQQFSSTIPSTTSSSSSLSASSTTSQISSSKSQKQASVDPSPSSSAGSSGSNNNSNNDDDGGGDKLGTSDIIGIVIGVLGFVATLIGAWFSYKAIKKNKRHQAQPEMAFR